MTELDLQVQGFNKNILGVLAQYNVHQRLLVINSGKLIVN